MGLDRQESYPPRGLATSKATLNMQSSGRTSKEHRIRSILFVYSSQIPLSCVHSLPSPFLCAPPPISFSFPSTFLSPSAPPLFKAFPLQFCVSLPSRAPFCPFPPSYAFFALHPNVSTYPWVHPYPSASSLVLAWSPLPGGGGVPDGVSRPPPEPPATPLPSAAPLPALSPASDGRTRSYHRHRPIHVLRFILFVVLGGLLWRNWWCSRSAWSW